VKADEGSFGFMREENNIEIPFFQRPYVWNKVQWEQLFNDLLNSFREQRLHFLGSIILKQLPSSMGEGSRRSLIDGQQRLTTFSILVKSIYDLLEEDRLVDYVGFLYAEPTKYKNPKIKHSHINRSSFEAIIKAKDYSEVCESECDDKLFACYKYFSEKLKESGLKNNEIINFLNYIVRTELWVVINLNGNEDEQKIFDSINSAGLILSSMDIIKNAIFDRLIKSSEMSEEKANEIYNEYWKSIFEGSNERLKFWEEKASRRYRSEILLYAYALIKGFFNIEKHTQDGLSMLYKEYIKDKSQDDVLDIIKEINRYANLFYELPWADKGETFKFSDSEKRLLHIMSISEYNIFIPVVLKLRSLELDKKELDECYAMLENFIIRHWLCKKVTNSINKVIGRNLKNINGKDSMQKFIASFEVTGDEEIKEAMFNIDNKRASLVLFWIELYNCRSEKNDISELQYTYTLEHLMPQTWQENWSNVGKNDEIAKGLIYQIGNMTLLKSKLNTAIQNNNWDKKREEIQKHAMLKITQEVTKNRAWNKNKIEERSEKIFNDFLKIWQNPTIN
jgi:hypothetical protein CCC13826_0823